MAEFVLKQVQNPPPDLETDCRVSTEAIWGASCGTEVAGEMAFGGADRGMILTVVERAVRELEAYEGVVDRSFPEAKIPLIHARQILEKSLTLDEESRVIIQDDLVDAGDRLRVVAATEVVDCLLG